MDEGLLKAFLIRWCSNTNTVLTCYEEMGMSLRDVSLITGLPIVEEMYDKFCLSNELIRSKKLPHSLRLLFKVG